MKLYIYQLNRAGLSDDVIKAYQSTITVLEMILDLLNGATMPSIIVYPEMRNGKYTIADGIHRICAYMFLNITSFEAKFKT